MRFMTDTYFLILFLFDGRENTWNRSYGLKTTNVKFSGVRFNTIVLDSLPCNTIA